MLLLVYSLIRAPQIGWGNALTVGELCGSAVLLGAFVINEQRHPNPIAPLSISRSGSGPGNAPNSPPSPVLCHVFFVTLYMQNVLGYSPMRAGMAYLRLPLEWRQRRAWPPSCSQDRTRPSSWPAPHRLGRRVLPLADTGARSYVTNLLPGLLAMSIGLGAVFVGVTTAANAGVPADKAGLAAGLVNTSQCWAPRRSGHLHRHLYGANQPPVAVHAPALRPHPRLPTGLALLQHLPTSGGGDRPAGHRHPRRASRVVNSHRASAGPGMTQPPPFADLVALDHGLCVNSTVGLTGASSRRVNAGVIRHPVTTSGRRPGRPRRRPQAGIRSQSRRPSLDLPAAR